MNHMPFILGAYAIAIAVPLFFSVEVWFRLRSAQRRLAAVGARSGRVRS